MGIGAGFILVQQPELAYAQAGRTCIVNVTSVTLPFNTAHFIHCFKWPLDIMVFIIVSYYIYIYMEQLCFDTGPIQVGHLYYVRSIGPLACVYY